MKLNKRISMTLGLGLVFSLASYAASFANTVRLQWSPNQERDLAGYKVYYNADSSTFPLNGTGASEGSSPIDVRNNPTATLTGLKAGHTYYFAVTAYNTSGKESAFSNVISKNILDTTPPIINAFVIPGTSTNLKISVTLNATDDTGTVAGYLLSEDPSAAYNGNASWSSVLPTSYTFASAGTKTLYAWARDAAGNVSSGVGKTVVVTLSDKDTDKNTDKDTTKPVISAFTVPSSTTSFTIPITSLAATDNKGVTGYMVTGTSMAPSPSTTGWMTTPPTSFTVTYAGTKTLYAWAKDAAGNVSSGAGRTVVVTLPDKDTDKDTTKPVISAFTVPSSTTSFTIPITSLTATDNKGVTGYMVTGTSMAPSPSTTGWSATPPTSFTVTYAGTKTLYAWVKDAAGNVSSGVGRTVVVTLK